LNRRSFLASLGALVPTFLMSKAEASPTFSLTKTTNASLGAKITKSSTLKVGKSLAFNGKSTNGQAIEVILTRTNTGVTALDGTCTHQGCMVQLQKASIICPCHGSVFNPNTGAPLMGPNGSPKSSIQPLAQYTVTEKSGYIYIK